MKVSIRFKIAIGFAIIIAVLTLLGFYSLGALKKVNEKSEEINSIWLEGVDIAHTIHGYALEYRIEESKHIVSDTLSKKSIIENSMKEITKKMEEAIESKLQIDQSHSGVLEEDILLLEELKNKWTDYMKISEELINLSRDLKNIEASKVLERESKEVFDEVNKSLEVILEFNRTHSNEAYLYSQQIFEKQKMILPIVILICVIFAVMIGIYLSIAIRKPISKMLEISKKVSKGDLTQKVKIISQDELGQLGIGFNEMVEKLKEIVGKIRHSIIETNKTSKELSNSAEENSQGAQQIAESINQIAESIMLQTEKINNVFSLIDELSTMIEQAGENAEKVKHTSHEASKLAYDGNLQSREAMDQMSTINGVIEESEKVVLELNNKTKKIGGIVDLINGISEQTNLLALNAAIEAARAGENGKGFAVVADEIKKLSEESVQATKGITNIISEIQSETIQAVKSIHKGTEMVQSGNKSVHEVGNKFEIIQTKNENVLDEIKRLSTAIQNIIAYNKEIYLDMKQIMEATQVSSHTIQTLGATAQEEAAAMEQISCSANKLMNMAEDLKASIITFNI
ncbi:methyl-accepting chemotaxis protein [Defluviitalea saccharophila]|uniref:Methyl-accepting chemotaxis protein n=1 Tax=Defluviitalea saccharophila TaxID=879970 RepID=A0ABZ2Y0X1_9FIRM